jgi:hypothetical protein
MKNLFNVGFIVLVLVVLGCNCKQIQELANESKNTPPPSVSNTSTVPTTTNSPASTSSAGISMEKYNQIKNDMKKSEVEKIIGSAGEEISSSSGGGFTFSTFKWSGENFATIIISYKDDKVMSKSQYGLK